MSLSTIATADEIAGELGYPSDLVMVRAKMFKIPFSTVPGPDGYPAKITFTIEDAVRLVERCRECDEDHRQKWQEYQAYLAAEKEKAVRREREAIIQARAEAEKRYAKRAAEERERRQREAAAIAAEKAEARNRKDGEPMPFEKFVKRKAKA